MKNNDNKNKTWLVWLALTLVSVGQLMAQTLTVHAPSNISAGTSFRVQFEADGKARDFTPPSFKGLSVLSGPSTSSSSSSSWINGKVSHSESTGFSYILRADQEGTVTVGPATCVVDGKKVQSASFLIHVTKADPNARQNSQQGRSGYYGGGQPRQPQQQQQQQSVAIDQNSLFARAQLSKSNPYKGEEVILTYKIYTQVSLRQYQIDKLPGNKGFWSEDLSEGKDIKMYQETVNGRTYQVAEIRRGALFAQDDGKLTIDPLKLEVLAVVPVQRRRTGTIWDLFDDPFFNPQQAVQKELKSNAVSVNVKPLPTAPDHFYGGVGSFEVKNSLDQQQVKANEAITYTITVSGRGNLPLLEAPELEFPKVFDVYEPKVTDHIIRGDNGISGSRTFEWVLIPQSKGNYTIPAFEYVYFNPKTGSYTTLHTQAFEVKVDKGDGSSRTVTSQHDSKLLNNDINHIKSHSGPLMGKGEGTRASLLQFVLMAVVVLVFVVLLLWGRKHQALESDVQGSRRRHALKLAQKRLRKAQQYLAGNDDAKFYEEIYKVLWGCLSDKYSIELSQLSRETVQEVLQQKGIAQDKMSLIMGTLQDVDMARFAPGDSSAHKQAIYNKTLDTIAALV